MSEPESTAPPPTARRAIGIDVGGTGVKAAVVDLDTGALASPRIRLKTPQPSTPAAVVEAIGAIVETLTAGGHVTPGMRAGAGLPGVAKNGRLLTAANIDKSWIGADAAGMISARIGHPCVLINDADAAGLAEVTFGAARNVPGTVLLLTIGTGIGSALFIDGHLLDSTEFGHITYHGHDAETLISGAARERRKLGWHRWARGFSEYLALLERWFWPDLIILGGGVSKEYARYSRWLTARAPIVTAQYLNTSGIVGAALAAAGIGQAASLLAREGEAVPAAEAAPGAAGATEASASELGVAVAASPGEAALIHAAGLLAEAAPADSPPADSAPSDIARKAAAVGPGAPRARRRRGAGKVASD